MFRYVMAALVLSALAAWPAAAQDSDQSDKPLDVTSSVGDLHVGKDADAKKAGLPLYPGARPKHEQDNDPLNFGILTESFGFKLVVAKYESDDPAEKILAYYKDKMKKYGTVLECQTRMTTARSIQMRMKTATGRSNARETTRGRSGN